MGVSVVSEAVADGLLSVHGIPQARKLGCHLLVQGIFPPQGLNPGLLHWQADSLPLSHLGSLVRNSASKHRV